MEIGTAILIGTIFIGLVLLYGQTKDRMRWGKVIRNVLIATILVAGALIGTLYAIDQFEDRRVVQSELAGVKLGESKGDVMFKFGQPKWTCHKPSPSWTTYVFDDEPAKKQTIVRIVDDSVRQVILVDDDLAYSLKGGPNISNYFTVDDVRRTWGPEDGVDERDDVQRIYVYEKYKLAIWLINNRVTALAVFQPPFHYDGRTGERSKCFDDKGNPMK